MDSNSSNISISIRIYWTHFTTSVAASSGSKVLHSPYCSLPRMYFFIHVECFLFLFSNKLAAPKLHATVIKEQASTIIPISSAIFLKRLGCGFLGRVIMWQVSPTKSGRAPLVEFSQNQTCRRPGRRAETRTFCLVGSDLVCSGRVGSGCTSGIWFLAV